MKLLRSASSRLGRKFLDVRELHPERSLAEHYNPLAMAPALVKAHDALDREVDNAMGAPRKLTSERQCQKLLFADYTNLSSKYPTACSNMPRACFGMWTMVANMLFLKEDNEPRELSVIDASTARLRSLFSTTGGRRLWWGINADGFGFSVGEVVDYFPMVQWVDGAVKRNQSPGSERSRRWCTFWEAGSRGRVHASLTMIEVLNVMKTSLPFGEFTLFRVLGR